mgnify:CR=1 FL=1
MTAGLVVIVINETHGSLRRITADRGARKDLRAVYSTHGKLKQVAENTGLIRRIITLWNKCRVQYNGTRKMPAGTNERSKGR